MVKTLNVFDLKDNNKVYESYKRALSSKYSSLMVEYSEKF